ncbi:MAG: alanyl-tRNA synthetase, partial [Pseudonocardiales bacterium]|nr:alanyl-tRNA synthetase [Pseudonocardiales bacterium]
MLESISAGIVIGVDAHDIRQAFLDLLSADGHAVVERAPIVLRDDPTTLFTGSGMQPLLPYLLGAEHPRGTRLADVQPCLRAQDMDEVGDNRHTTFFEMLGNWSLGDYDKAEQIPRLFHFLVDVVGLDPNRIYVSCFIGDA